jgi:hypothetical protein
MSKTFGAKILSLIIYWVCHVRTQKIVKILGKVLKIMIDQLGKATICKALISALLNAHDPILISLDQTAP